MAIVTLTTDFGESDHFVGVMKGVILSLAPRATIVDITHQIPAFEIVEAAFVIGEAYKHFPKGTVHVAVVDPGVGTERRPIVVEAAGQFFVAPDNGVLAMVYGREKSRVRHLTKAKYFAKAISSTFHGRDIFAPVAGHISAGVKPASMGQAVNDYLQPSGWEPARVGKRHWSGQVLKVDRFGNLITNFRAEALPDILTRPFEMITGVTAVERLVQNYAQGTAGEPVAILGSSGYIEVVVNQASAAKALGCTAGSPVELTIY